MRRFPAFLFLLTLLSVQVHAEVLDVFPDGSGPYPDLQQAILATSPGDSIRLASGIFTGPGNRNVILGGGGITIFSASGDPADCILDFEGQGRGFLIYTMTTTQICIEGFTMRGGNPESLPEELWNEFGGGLMVKAMATGGDVLIERCVFEDNRAEAGGAAFLWNGEAEFLGCVLRNNLATDGAGIYCGFCGVGDGVRVRDSVFSGNDYPYPEVGGYGSGIYFGHSVGAVENCTFAANRAWYGAGLLVSTDSDVLVQNCLIAFSGQGDGLAVHEGEVEISGCDIFGNAGGDWVGAIADQLDISCNFSADPIFCDAAAEDFTLREDSPCLPENNGDCGLVGALSLGCSISTAVGPQASSPAARPRLGACFPNPSNPATTIRFDVPSGAERLRLEIIDANGRRVAVLAEGLFTAGRHEVVWRGTGDDGRPVASGVYFFRLSSSRQDETRKLVLLR